MLHLSDGIPSAFLSLSLSSLSFDSTRSPGKISSVCFLNHFLCLTLPSEHSKFDVGPSFLLPSSPLLSFLSLPSFPLLTPTLIHPNVYALLPCLNAIHRQVMGRFGVPTLSYPPSFRPMEPTSSRHRLKASPTCCAPHGTSGSSPHPVFFKRVSPHLHHLSE